MGSITGISNLQHCNRNHLHGTQQAGESPTSCHSQGTCRAGGAGRSSWWRNCGKMRNARPCGCSFAFQEIRNYWEILAGFGGFFCPFFFKGGKRLFIICQHFHPLHTTATDRLYVPLGTQTAGQNRNTISRRRKS